MASDAKVESNDSGLQEPSLAAEQMQVKDGESMRVSCDRFGGMEVPAKIRKAWHDNVSDILEKNGDAPAESAQTAQPIATPTSRPEGIPAPLLGSGKWPRVLRLAYMCNSRGWRTQSGPQICNRLTRLQCKMRV